MLIIELEGEGGGLPANALLPEDLEQRLHKGLGLLSDMSVPTPFPAGQPAHPLDYWTSPELAQVSPPNAQARLRQLADAQGTLAAAWSSAIGSGPVLLLAGGFVSAISGSPAGVLILGLLGVALTVLGLVSWKRVRGTLPNTNRLLIARGPGSARGGVRMVSVLAIMLGGILVAVFPGITSRGTAALVAVSGSYVLFVALLAAFILIPSVVLGRARPSFRRRIQTDPGLRTAVEGDLARWRDPHGNAGYGPL